MYYIYFQESVYRLDHPSQSLNNSSNLMSGVEFS